MLISTKLALLSKSKSAQVVKFGAEKLEMELPIRPNPPARLAKDGTEMELALRKVMFWAETKFGNSMINFMLLAAKTKLPVTFLMSLTLTEIKAVLAVKSKFSTVESLIPAKVVKPVLVMTTLPALLIPLVKVKACKLGRAWKLMEPTVRSSGKLSEVNRMMPDKPNSSPMVVSRGAEIEVTLVAPSAVKLPVISWIPLNVRPFAAWGKMTMSPSKVSQLERESASAWEVMLVIEPALP
ncbi:hypothetical protein TMatcc_003727, partial [Talaromyces marneffei ATCC 18224]